MAQSFYRFGEFELHSSRFELRRGGRTVKLERIPMELLILLVDRNGEVVLRQEIVDRLWGKDVFVDTEHGINTAIRKIRTALGEDADRAKFVRTVPGKGYSFVAELNREEAPANGNEPKMAKVPVAVAVAEPSVLPPASKWRHWRPVAGGLALLIASGIVLAKGGWTSKLFAPANGTQIRSIAVLPLANLSGDPSQDYFADGMTDELITMLARNTSLRVVSRTSVMQYKGVGRPLREVARELGVDCILEGSVNRTPSRVRLNLQLVDAHGDSHIWANSYDRDVRDIYSFPAELAYIIAKQVKTETAPAKPQRYVDPQAHDAYLRGRFFWFADDYPRSLDFMKKAIERQPDYAAAWSGLADDYIVVAVAEQVPPREVMEKAQTAVRKALELDDSLPEAHNTMAALHLFYDWDWKRADEESRRAVELNPDFAEAHHLRAYLLTAMNRSEEALQEQTKASGLDPFARPFALGFVLTLQGEYDEAIEELKERKKDLPQDMIVRMCLSLAYRLKGMPRESTQEFVEVASLQGDRQFAADMQRAFDKGGDRGVAAWRIKRRSTALAREAYLSPLVMAEWQARAGNKEATMNALEKAYEERTPFLIFLQHQPDFGFLHSEPRYQAIIQKMGLPPAY